MMLIAFLLASQAADLPGITVSKSANGYRAEAATFDASREADVYAEIDRRAATLCGDKQIKWGKFGSVAKIDKDSTKGPTEISGFFKEFSCVVAAEPKAASISPDWKASQVDDADVRRFFEGYYSKRDAGDFEAAFAMFAPDSRPEVSTQAGIRETKRKLGTGRRRVAGVTWYVNPASAPRLGAYAALDFVGEYTGAHVYCGYLVLYRLGPGSYEIVREEQNIFERNNEAVDPVQVDLMRSATCRGN